MHRMADGYSALTPHLAALEALGRPKGGDDEHHHLRLEPELASQWRDLHSQRASGAVLA